MPLCLAAVAETGTAEPLSLAIQIPLSIMNFLQFAIWGAWWVVLGNYLNALGFERKDIGRIYTTQPWGAVIAPMFIGTIADRYFASEQVLGVLHLIGALLLFWLATIKTPRAFFWIALAYALCYAPTIALSTSVVFGSVKNAVEDFPVIRVLGTVGWIAAGMSLWFLVKPGQPMNNRPILFAGFLSLVLGVYSFFLPHVPPPPGATPEVPFMKAFALLGEPRFAVFFTVSFFITIALAFYYSFTPLFLENAKKVAPKNVGPIMSIGQWVEIVFLLSLPWFIKTFGIEYVIMWGMLAWGLRYAIFASLGPLPLILVGVALHGICFDFFFGSGFIYVEQNAPKDIQASGQALFAVLTYGLGMLIGSEASGRLNQYCTKESIDPNTGAMIRTTDWRVFWIVPCAGVLLCLAAYYALLSFFQLITGAR
jgi:nucleoside transporter